MSRREQIKDKIEGLETRLGDVQYEIRDKKADIEELDEQLKSVRNNIDDLEKEENEIESDLDDLHSELQDMDQMDADEDERKWLESQEEEAQLITYDEDSGADE